MMTNIILVKLAAAVICFNGQCYPALVGADTPTGTFAVEHIRVPNKGYDGDVIAFKDDGKYVWAIHRLWRLNPRQHRLQRIESGNAKERHITMGCINVMPPVYDELTKCCTKYKLVIER